MEAVLITCLQLAQLTNRVNQYNGLPVIVRRQIISELVRVAPKSCPIDAHD
jgi:hypothetical protein